MFTFCLLTFHTTFLLTSHHLTGRALFNCPIKYHNHDGAAGANVIMIIIKSNSNVNEFSLLKGSIKCIIDSASLADLVKVLYQICSMFIEHKPFEHCRQLAKYFFSHFPSSLLWSPPAGVCVASGCFHQRYLCGPALVEYSFLPFGAGGEFGSAVPPFLVITFSNQTFCQPTAPPTHTYRCACAHTCK